jgi:hypothetical protein
MNDITLCNQCRRVIKGQIFFHVRRTFCGFRCVDTYEVEKDRQYLRRQAFYPASDNRSTPAANP